MNNDIEKWITHFEQREEAIANRIEFAGSDETAEAEEELVDATLEVLRAVQTYQARVAELQQRAPNVAALTFSAPVAPPVGSNSEAATKGREAWTI